MNEVLNHYVQELFAGNAKMDNVYYNLKFLGFNNLANSVHEPVAHLLAGLADKVTDFMDLLSYRPTRIGLQDETAEMTVEECYNTIEEYFNNLILITLKVVEEADLHDECAIKIFMEEFLSANLLKLQKQAKEWKRALEQLGPHQLNVHILDYTNYIPLWVEQED